MAKAKSNQSETTEPTTTTTASLEGRDVPAELGMAVEAFNDGVSYAGVIVGLTEHGAIVRDDQDGKVRLAEWGDVRAYLEAPATLPPPAAAEMLADAYAEELPGIRVGLPGTNVHVHGEVMSYNYDDWRDALGQLLALTVTPRQAALIGLRLVRATEKDRAALTEAGYTLPEGPAPAPTAEQERPYPPAAGDAVTINDPTLAEIVAVNREVERLHARLDGSVMSQNLAGPIRSYVDTAMDGLWNARSALDDALAAVAVEGKPVTAQEGGAA